MSQLWNYDILKQEFPAKLVSSSKSSRKAILLERLDDHDMILIIP